MFFQIFLVLFMQFNQQKNVSLENGLKVLSDHLNWGARLCSFGPM